MQDTWLYDEIVTIDELLAKLAERHEALSQTVEILAAMQRENEQRIGQVLEAINRLANIAEAHQSRLDDPEGPLDDPSHGS